MPNFLDPFVETPNGPMENWAREQLFHPQVSPETISRGKKLSYSGCQPCLRRKIFIRHVSLGARLMVLSTPQPLVRDGKPRKLEARSPSLHNAQFSDPPRSQSWWRGDDGSRTVDVWTMVSVAEPQLNHVAEAIRYLPLCHFPNE